MAFLLCSAVAMWRENNVGAVAMWRKRYVRWYQPRLPWYQTYDEKLA